MLESLPNGSAWPRISIVTPSYNQGHFIEETIRSILLQGYPNLEYLIIDGGSSDNTVEIIKKYEPWLAYWVSEPDRGQSHAINKGFARCTGEIITFQNSDDIYLPGTLADVGRRWTELEQAGALVGGFHFMDYRSRLEGRYYPPRLSVDGPVDLTLGPPGLYRLHQVSAFYNCRCLDTVGRRVREDLRYTMDRDLLYRVSRASKILLAERAYGAFRRHEASKSVADILPFAREFETLYLSYQSDNVAENKRRQQMARHHRVKGYIKYAQYNGKFLSSIWALMTALLVQPDYLFQRKYLTTWLEVLHLKSIIKRLLHLEKA